MRLSLAFLKYRLGDFDLFRGFILEYLKKVKKD